MADLYPFAAGNWSTNSNWYNAATGLTVNRQPTTGDNVWLNNKTITLDTTITCDKLSNKAFTGAVFSPAAGGSVSLTLTNSFYPTITVGSGGIEAVQATGTSNLISVSGSSTTGSTSKFLIDCSGPITGGYSTSTNAISLTCTGTKIQINAASITGGITDRNAAAILNNGTTNTIYVNCSGIISASTGCAIRMLQATTTLIVKASTSIDAGALQSAISFQANNSNTQYIGYTCDFSTATPTISLQSPAIPNINASTSFPAIQSFTAAEPYNNTTPIQVNAASINGSTNGIFGIQAFNFKLISTATIKVADFSATLQSFIVGGTSYASFAAQMWDYLTASATTSGSLGKLIVDNLNAKVGDVKTATDRIPTNPASVQSTGDQIATLQ